VPFSSPTGQPQCRRSRRRQVHDRAPTGLDCLVGGDVHARHRALAHALDLVGEPQVLTVSVFSAGEAGHAFRAGRGHGVGHPESAAALELLTKSWAAEYGPRGVRVNAVSPGPTRTPGTVGMGENLEQLAAAAPAGRAASPEEIAEAVVYLATDRSSFVHGVVLPVDGGRVAV
jgi:NAD(P)-dependent dehydrogenase (short-subunit alcohol dehydrogenase family)